MKIILIAFLLFAMLCTGYAQPKMQATIKAGNTPYTIDLYLNHLLHFYKKTRR